MLPIIQTASGSTRASDHLAVYYEVAPPRPPRVRRLPDWVLHQPCFLPLFHERWERLQQLTRYHDHYIQLHATHGCVYEARDEVLRYKRSLEPVDQVKAQLAMRVRSGALGRYMGEV